jgi:hypothetical protein
MTLRGKRSRTLLCWLAGLAVASVGLSSVARAGDFFSDLKDNFNLHGYVEAQQIWRNENFAKDYHVASLRNRIDLQPSGQIIKDANLGPI